MVSQLFIAGINYNFLNINMDFDTVTQFERAVAEYWWADHAVAVDSCTHGIELCLRLQQITHTNCPTRTYISIPFTLDKLNIQWTWNDRPWWDWYQFSGTNIVDAATFWCPQAYLKNTWQVLSFQHRKALKLGRGGMILLDDAAAANELRKMAYDGRERNVPWALQSITTPGYHYYMTPETAQQGIDLLPTVDHRQWQNWNHTCYPDLSTMPVFDKLKNSK